MITTRTTSFREKSLFILLWLVSIHLAELMFRDTHTAFILDTFYTGDTVRIISSMFLAALVRLLPVAILQSLLLRLFRQKYWFTWGIATLSGGLIPIIYVSGFILQGDSTIAIYHSPQFINNHVLMAVIGTIIPQWWILSQHYRHAWLWLLLIPIGLLPVWLMHPLFRSINESFVADYTVFPFITTLNFILPPILLTMLLPGRKSKRKENTL